MYFENNCLNCLVLASFLIIISVNLFVVIILTVALPALDVKF